ncbi:MAG: hypothetical protein QM785_07785 [Pyrinomonadaceae bacterium]
MKILEHIVRDLAFVMLTGGLSIACGQTFDIASGGTPTINGSLSGSVSGSGSTLNNLSVTVNFGEVSPANTNNLVKVVVPIAIRGTGPYKVTASISGGTNANPQALQQSDVGFGVNNLRGTSALSRVCLLSSHVFYSPFSSDPSANVTIGGNGRAAYTASLSNITTPATIMSGPPPSLVWLGRSLTDGYIFDAIFTVTPQYYGPGSTSATITFTISSGPFVLC